jgi:uncharacterized protein with von Willebrand factor type A (vWA) domain
MKGFHFKTYEAPEQSPFDRLFEIFKELIVHTSGDFDEAISWMRELDVEYKLTDEKYTIDDFIEDLKKKGYIKEEIQQDGNGETKITSKTERAIRQQALNNIFGNLQKAGKGNHKTKTLGQGDEKNGEFKEFNFGDNIENISLTESIKNAQINHGIGDFNLTENDLVIEETEQITPAKKVAMAFAELITTRYPKDTIDILVFGDDAWTISIQELPYLKVGPYHTNTVAGLQLAMDILRRKRNTNKQIFMITDGKPSCIKEADGTYYMNSNGLDQYIVEKCYNQAKMARKLHIPITTFMIAQDPYLQKFVNAFTEANQGKAFYTGLKGLGEMIFEDYETNRKKKLK